MRIDSTVKYGGAVAASATFGVGTAAALILVILRKHIPGYQWSLQQVAALPQDLAKSFSLAGDGLKFALRTPINILFESVQLMGRIAHGIGHLSSLTAHALLKGGRAVLYLPVKAAHGIGHAAHHAAHLTSVGAHRLWHVAGRATHAVAHVARRAAHLCAKAGYKVIHLPMTVARKVFHLIKTIIHKIISAIKAAAHAISNLLHAIRNNHSHTKTAIIRTLQGIQVLLALLALVLSVLALIAMIV